MSVELFDVVCAIERDELIPFFQPIVALCSGKLTGFEVLARWHHPTLGYVLPKNFISLAEQNDLIGGLTHQVLGKAFLMASNLPDSLILSVNLSPSQMHLPALPSLVRDTARAGRFPLHRVTIEITESALLIDLSRAKNVVRELKSMGCGLSLDDFGKGYSSLHYLQELPFDEIKMDRSFVSSMTSNRASCKIAAAIIGLGQSLGLSTVAEGIETDEQAEMVSKLGCEKGQGWRYGHPVPWEGIDDILGAAPRPAPASAAKKNNRTALSDPETDPGHRVAQLQAIYDFAPVGLCFMDRQFRYLSVNERLSRMSGLPVAVHLGRTVEDLYPHWFKRYEPYLRRALLGEAIGGVQVELPSARPGDTESIALASLQPALDELGEVVGILIAVTEPHGEHLQLGFDWMRPIENEWRTECSTGSQLRVAN